MLFAFWQILCSHINGLFHRCQKRKPCFYEGQFVDEGSSNTSAVAVDVCNGLRCVAQHFCLQFLIYSHVCIPLFTYDREWCGLFVKKTRYHSLGSYGHNEGRSQMKRIVTLI